MRLLTAREMREADRRAMEEYCIPGLVLMENAGAAVARAAALLAGRGRRVLILAGPGNNGGDGFVAARHLVNASWDVRVFCQAARERYQGDALANLVILERLGITLQFMAPAAELARAAGGVDLLVDALLGTGAKGPARGPIRDAILIANATEIPVLAVDVPSGVDSDTGEVHEPAVRATVTVTFGWAKRGHFLGEGSSHTGRLEVADISLPHQLGEAGGLELITARRVREWLPPQRSEDHKGSRGRALILAGGPGFLGAARLSAAAAVRSGAGLVTLAVPQGLWGAVSSAGPWEVLTRGMAAGEDGAVSAAALPEVLEYAQGMQAVLAGPGLTPGVGTQAVVEGLLSQVGLPLVLDADALNVLAGKEAALQSARGSVVLTPHPGEMGRLLGISTQEVQADRVGVALQAAARFRCVMVLKGRGTLVAGPEGELFLNSTGNPLLATGGTGDILAGMVTAFAAQGMPALAAAVAAVYLHGLAADILAQRQGGRGFAAGDLLPILAEAFRQVEGER